MPDIPTIKLNNGVTMPQLGLGVWQVPDGDTASVVTTALEAGYRSIDTATAYGNEEGVGKAVADFPREQLFVTTKLDNSDQGYDEALRAFDKSMTLLGLDYLDLYLIHWPMPKTDRYVETWKALIRLADEGRVTAIGVSNFQPSHLERIINETGRVPAVNQIELHPFLQQNELRHLHTRLGIATEAWSPLASGGDLLTHPTIVAIGKRIGRTPAQVVLRWHLQLGNVVIPKSVTPERIAQNIDVVDFELAESDMAELSTLDKGHRTGPDPDHVG
nr:aldo/keto reductase [Kibdelosporangium sp. MJ126-NF4]CEL20656.1 oxidoreductase of aldo/keto reductase family, subgroup 1 [Kibdelosporangium sp. MJ126-NF4]CTQ89568.1 oxidoreductase of aldo/keto reductase family, subgroup 1 [Kibdelosporangium sp. MJ126-NF4]